MQVDLQSKSEISLEYLRQRLIQRHRFFTRFTLLSDIISSLAIFGIILMIIANELTFDQFHNQQTIANWSIKLIITISTFILLILIIYYNYLDMIFYARKNLLYNWQVQLNLKRICLIILELCICAIHPFPRKFPSKTNSTVGPTEPYSLSYTAIDVALGLPMFLRLYLLGRTIMMHSHSFRHVTLRSFGYLNHISMDSYFFIKSYLDHWPTRSLTVVVTLVFFIGSWSLRACNYRPTNEHISMSDAMWLFVITFTTVGYGDLYPSTYCGRTVAAIIAFIGLLSSALLIAILTKKLLLTREQKYVHTFILNTRLRHKYKHQAANVVKFTIKLWFIQRQAKRQQLFSYFRLQQKLFRAIQSFQFIRQDKEDLVDTCLDFTDVMATQQHTKDRMDIIQNEIKEINRNLFELNHSIDMLQKTLNHFVK